jgi:lactate permease
MPPVLAGAAAFNSAAYGLFPIGWIVLGAIFVYDIAVKSGGFEIVKDTIAGVASDRRIRALLIAFCFGAFIEGAAGFGTPVAISSAMLIGLGFRPLQAAGLALIANTAPVAFGALGIPVNYAGERHRSCARAVQRDGRAHSGAVLPDCAVLGDRRDVRPPQDA